MAQKKKRTIRIIKRVLKVILLLIIGGILYSFGVASYENIKVNQMVKKFIQRSTLESTIQLDENTFRKYYKVKRKQDEKDQKNVFSDANKMSLGQRGDIFLTQISPLENLIGIHQFVSFYFGGHASIYIGDNRFIESVGFSYGEETIWDVITYPNTNSNHGFGVHVDYNETHYWLDNEYDLDGPYYGYYRDEFFGIRIKGATPEVIDKVVDYGEDKIAKKSLYNYLFFLDMTNKYYCTDLVSRAYHYAFTNEETSYAKSLNDDGFITSVNDLLLSRDTYLAFYVKIEKVKGIIYENIYYLEDM